MATPAKDFGPIRDDYAFFEEHSTEATADLAGYRALMERTGLLEAGRAQTRMLDFGCGPGTFTERQVALLAQPRDADLVLIEPQEVYRQQAAQRMGEALGRPVEAFAHRAPDGAAFDLVTANHVFYYVSDLEQVVARLTGSLAPGGVMITSMAGTENLLIQLWRQAFAMLGIDVPYHTGEALERALGALGVEAASHRIDYRLEFPDTDDNRAALMRFLLGEYLDQLPLDQALALLDPYAIEGQISADVRHRQWWWRRRPS